MIQKSIVECYLICYTTSTTRAKIDDGLAKFGGFFITKWGWLIYILVIPIIVTYHCYSTSSWTHSMPTFSRS